MIPAPANAAVPANVSVPPRPLAWLGTALAIGLSLLMLYLPYEFQAPPHRFVYPYLVWFGVAFCLSALLTAAGLARIGVPTWVEWMGQGLFVVSLVLWAWGVAYLPGVITGMIAYGLLVIVFAVSAVASRLDVVLHRVLYSLLPVALGTVMLAWPRLFPASIYGDLGGALGGAMLVAGLLQGAILVGGRWQPRSRLAPWTLVISTVPLAGFAWQWGRVNNWLGVCIYGILAAGALLPVLIQRLPQGVPVRGLRRRILAMAILLTVVPLFGLGAFTVRAIQRLDREQTLGTLRLAALHAERVSAALVADGTDLSDPDGLARQVWQGMNGMNGPNLKVQVQPLQSLPVHWPVQPGISAFEELDAAGQRNLIAIVVRPDLGVAVAALRPSQSAYNHARPVASTLLLVSLVIIGLAVAASLPISRYLTSRLTDVRRVAEAVGAQHFDARTAHPGISDDEVDYLAASINAMAATIGTYSREIEEQNRRLRAQAEDLAEANAAKDRFLAVLSHELRNPLSVIQAGVDTLERQPATAPVKKAIALVGRNAQVLVRLAADLLELSRAVAGKVTLRLLPLRLDEFVAGAVAQMQPRAKVQGLMLVMAPAPAVRVVADPERLEQVIGNLIGNAIKFTPQGGRIMVSVAEVNGWARLEVTDTGIGLNAHEQAHLFDMFWQGPRTGRGQAGLGIGLALVRQLVELHGGRVGATSPGPGQGSAFGVELPTLAAQTEAAASATGSALRTVAGDAD